MKHLNLTVLLLLCLWGTTKAQTYTGPGGAIPDDGTFVEFSINVSGLSPSTIDTANFGLESVCINAIHPWDSDLEFTLIAPNGQQILMISGCGGDGDNFTNTCLNGNVGNSIVNSSAPFTGTFRPLGFIGNINNGQNGNGIWKLHVYDTWAWADAGNLIGWNITFGNNPSPAFDFQSSNLPIVVINTSGQSIPDDPKITAQMGIIYNGPGIRNYMTDPFNHYNGDIGIELRGSSSQSFPKKSYGFETRDISGISIDVPLLGMPAENDWCFIANYTDKTMMRNHLSYTLSGLMGNYAARNRYCEIVINNNYMGVYLLTEKIKRDSVRIDISSLTPLDNYGDQLTGGYIFKIDKNTGGTGQGWISDFAPMQNPNGQVVKFQYEYPESDVITVQQKVYINAYVDSFEVALDGPSFADSTIGYPKYIDIASFIDFFIINEISKNVDGYRLSTYIHKDKQSKGGKLVAGPVWDFDITWWNANYCGGNDPTGWAYRFGDVCPNDGFQVPFWWDRLLQDPAFEDALKCRWMRLRAGILDTNYLYNHIDSLALVLDEGQTRNFIQWPILGTWIWPNPSPLPQTYDEEINALRKWIRLRLGWLDDFIPGYCDTTDYSAIADVPSERTEFRIYPNPVRSGIVYFTLPEFSGTDNRLTIYDMNGRMISDDLIGEEYSSGTLAHYFNAGPGLYTAVFTTQEERRLQQFVVIE